MRNIFFYFFNQIKKKIIICFHLIGFSCIFIHLSLKNVNTNTFCYLDQYECATNDLAKHYIILLLLLVAKRIFKYLLKIKEISSLKLKELKCNGINCIRPINIRRNVGKGKSQGTDCLEIENDAQLGANTTTWKFSLAFLLSFS